MHRTLLAVLDWFIPNATLIERSKIGLARNFVLTHLLGPFLIQSIVVLLYFTDPEAGIACWSMMICIAAFWLLPFGLKWAQDLRLMALISVELLCVTSLIGTSFYGGVNSPFLPWLLVSLMLGFFYLSDHALRVLALFAFNIVAVICAHFLYHFPQHLGLTELGRISWISVFAATSYMSLMAIYYASIVTMSSELERETERHRLTARQLRNAKQRAETASHGKSVFLEKMNREFQGPLTSVVSSSQALIERLTRSSDTAGWRPEVERINVAGRRLLTLVQEIVDPQRIAIGTDGIEVQDFLLDEFLDRFVATVRPLISSHGNVLVLQRGRDLGRVRIDGSKLRKATEILVAKAAAGIRNGEVHLSIQRDRSSTGDWIELQVHASGSGADEAHSSERLPRSRASVPWHSDDRRNVDPDLETSQMHCAVLGGSLTVTRDADGGPCFTVYVPAFLIENLTDGSRSASEPRTFESATR